MYRHSEASMPSNNNWRMMQCAGRSLHALSISGISSEIGQIRDIYVVFQEHFVGIVALPDSGSSSELLRRLSNHNVQISLSSLQSDQIWHLILISPRFNENISANNCESIIHPSTFKKMSHSLLSESHPNLIQCILKGMAESAVPAPKFPHLLPVVTNSRYYVWKI